MSATTQRVIISHDTSMWNEGFDNAGNPWMAFYTESDSVVAAARQIVEQTNDEDNWERLFSIDSFMHGVDTAALRIIDFERTNMDPNDFEFDWGWEFGDISHLSDQEAILAITDRIELWDGI